MAQDANEKMTYMTDLQKLVNKLDGEGFTYQYKVENGKLHCLTNDKQYHAEDVKALNFYRFEGTSNPDDMSILYVIETNDGGKGTLIDAYGTYSDNEIGEFMQSVEIFKKTKREYSKKSDEHDDDKLPKDVLNKEEDPDSVRDPLEVQLEKTERIEKENRERRKQEIS